MWSKGNPCALWVGLQICAATVGNRMEVSQRIRNGAALWPRNSSSGYLSEENKTLIWKGICTPVFTAVIFATAQIRKQPGRPSIDERIKNMAYKYIHSGTLLSNKKEWNLAISDNMDGPRGYCAKCQRKTNTIDFTCMRNLKNKTNEQTKQKHIHWYREQGEGCQWGGWGMGDKRRIRNGVHSDVAGGKKKTHLFFASGTLKVPGREFRHLGCQASGQGNTSPAHLQQT